MEYIYGCGSFGSAISDCMTARNIPHHFIDGFSELKKHKNSSVFRPSEIIPSIEDRVWISAMSQPISKSHETQIYNIVKGLGFSHILDLERISLKLPDVWRRFVTDGFMWRQGTVSSLDILWNEEKSAIVEAHLLDEESKILFNQVKAFRQNPTWSNYPFPTTGRQYIELGSIEEKLFFTDIHMLDVGAFDGDTLQDFHEFFGKRFASYTAVEPILEQYESVLTRIDAINTQRTSLNLPPLVCSAINAAAGSTVYRTGFDLRGSASKLSPGSEENIVNVIRLDDSHADYNINFLKMDIEGSELDTLKGSVSLIKTQQPSLAIAVYHKPDDIWNIPLWFLDNFKAPRFSFRQHHHWGLELILYVTWDA